MFEPLPNGRIRLTQELYVPVWVDARHGIRVEIVVPPCYETDGASIPRLLWPIIGQPIGDRHLIPAVVHDWLCERATDYEQRVLGDAIFFSLLRQHNVPVWKRTLMYLAVRFYGRVVWRRKHVA